MYTTRTYERSHTFNHTIAQPNQSHIDLDAVFAAHPDGQHWQDKFEFVKDQVANLPLDDTTIKAIWTRHMKPLTDDNTWREYYQAAIAAKTEIDQVIVSRTVCIHTCKEIVPDTHDIEIGTYSDGSVMTDTVTDYYERCMTCGAITREHVIPLEA